MSEPNPRLETFVSPALAEAYFYEAFTQLDAGLMARVWFDSEQTYCVHPGGQPLLGYRSVVEGWQEMFRGAQPLVLFYKVVQRQSWENLAVHLVEERLSNRDGSQRGLVMASNCYVRTEKGWRLFSHHGSSLPQGRAAEPEESRHLH